MGAEEQIKEIEDEIARTQYNKATEKHIGKLKAKLAQLRAQEQKRSGKKGAGYSIKKSGDATVLLIGFPSTGKSTLLNRLTSASSKTGDYDFTTIDVIPGVMEYRGARIQIVDVPGVIEGAASGRGRGKEILSVVRNADLILIMIDTETMERLPLIEKELYEAGFRLNQKPPDVKVQKKGSGGIDITGAETCGMKRDTIVSVLKEFGIYNADVVIRENVSLERLIDAMMKNRVYVPALVIMNKIDKKRPAKVEKDWVLVSALKGTGIDTLRERIWGALGFMRIYMKKPGKEADMKKPLIMKKGGTVADVCKAMHRQVEKNFRFARVWGISA